MTVPPDLNALVDGTLTALATPAVLTVSVVPIIISTATISTVPMSSYIREFQSR
jgi:hypothetical protein